MVWQVNNYIPEPIRKSVSALKDKIASIYKSITLENAVYGREQKLSTLGKQIIQKPFISEEKINY